MLRRIPLIIVLLISYFTGTAQFHEDVFPGESGAPLITKLRLEFKPQSVLSYSEAREVMYTDLYNENDSVTCVYSGHKLYLNPNSSDPIGDLIQNSSSNGINCEHTFPQSKGAGSGNARSDMHHLFPARARVNEARLNYPYDEINDQLTEKWFREDDEQSNIPNSFIDEFSELGDEAFEPREDHKGNAARAIFYFYAVYRDVADASFFSGQRATLCEWHYQDPVDQREWDNNIKIASHQSDKRNPFILDCSLAERTFCPDVAPNCATTGVRDSYFPVHSVFPNPVNDVLTIKFDEVIHNGRIRIISGDGQIQLEKDVVHMAQLDLNIRTALPAGIYTLQFYDFDVQKGGAQSFVVVR